MNSDAYKKNICRICLADNVWLDWNTSLYQFHDTTYKDCYYKYTQLQYYETDPFPQMLCQNCCNALHSSYTLILTALESHKILQDKFRYYSQLQEEIRSPISNNIRVGDSPYTPAEFETVLVEKIEVEPIIDDHFEYDESSDEDNTNVECQVPAKSYRHTKSLIVMPENVKRKTKREQSVKTESEFEEPLRKPSNKSLETNAIPTKSIRKTTSKVRRAKTIINNKSQIIIEKHIIDKEQSMECNSNEYDLVDEIKTEKDGETGNVEPKVKKKYKEKKKPRMCSICSKILHNKYAVQMHEKTHIENRERKETCKVCGLKFYDKRNLYSHMHIHKENREKRHKCEFCSKAFYDKGGLNIHRRIHLGQMIPCSLCSKQYYRQIDLERHMSSHSATTINSDTKKRSRYFVRCQHCDKSILSTSFKSHTAAHLNEPLMKCSICGKEFFRRGSCVLHVKKVHQKTNEEYNDFIVMYKLNRISHLFLEQKADIQAYND